MNDLSMNYGGQDVRGDTPFVAEVSMASIAGRDPQVRAAVGDIESVIKGLYDSLDRLGTRLAPVLSDPVPMETPGTEQREGGCPLGNHLLMLASELRNVHFRMDDLTSRVEV